MNKPTATTLVRWTEKGKALLALPAQTRHLFKRIQREALARRMQGRALVQRIPGRALARRMPEPVQVELRKFSSRSVRLTREIFAGLLVVGLVAIVAGYGRLARGPVYLPSLVPPIEAAINGELSNLHVKIDDAVLLKSPNGPGVVFRLKNIRLLDDENAIVAQAPYAAIGLSGSALLTGRIAPGSVDFIGPRLLLFYSSQRGLALSFSQANFTSPTTGAPLSDRADKDEEKGEAQASPFGPLHPEPGFAGAKEASKAGSGRRLNVAKTIAQVFAQARRGDNSYLTRFGVQNATVVLSQNGRQTFWQVPRFSVNLEHKRHRSILLGQAVVNSAKGNWKFAFKTVQRPARHRLAVMAQISNLVPSGLAAGFSSMKAVDGFNVPVDGETNLQLSSAGQLLTWTADLHLRPGSIVVPWQPDDPMQIDGGDLHIRYHKDDKIVEVEPSTLRWGKSHITVSGRFEKVAAGQGAPAHWTYALKTDQALLAAQGFHVPPLKVDAMTAQGTIMPADGRVVLSRFVARAGGAEVVLAGSLRQAPGSPAMHLRGRFSPMRLDVFKQLWPKFIVAPARQWAGENVLAGRLTGGTVNIDIGPGELNQVLKHNGSFANPVDVTFDVAGLRVVYLKGLSPLVAPSAVLKLRGTSFEADLPSGSITLPSGDRIKLHQGEYKIADLRPKEPTAKLTFSGNGGTSAVLQLLNEKPLELISKLGRDPTTIGGTADGSFTVTIPMRKDLTLQDVAFDGSAQLKNVVMANAVGKLGIQDGDYQVNLTKQSVEMTGNVLVGGVQAQMTWQRVFALPDKDQPPVRLTAVLDDAARDKLGIHVNSIVKGLLPITLLVKRTRGAPPAIRLRADLTNTELTLSSVGWTKPSGQRATLETDIDTGPDGGTVLNNLQVRGDNGVDIDGWVSLDAERHLKAFHFANFSFDSETSAQISGEVGPDKVLHVKAEGSNYDGRQFFRALFSPDHFTATKPGTADSSDIDVEAHFDTVSGFYQTAIQNVTFSLKKHHGRLVALQANGVFSDQAPLAVRLEMDNGARVIKAETKDAGDAFRLVGFYRQVQGGDSSLMVNLDAGSGGTIRGILWARNFEVVSDRVVNNVLSDRQTAAAFGATPSTPHRSHIMFKRLRAPFVVGNDQFTLKNAYMNGPILGATMRGTVDFGAHTVDLGGTYVPLYGLNSALGQIPILGNILVGRQGEGIVGITFAIKGSLSDPAVLVNPISVVAPGIFRQIFEFNGTNNNDASRNGTSNTAPATIARPQ